MRRGGFDFSILRGGFQRVLRPVVFFWAIVVLALPALGLWGAEEILGRIDKVQALSKKTSSIRQDADVEHLFEKLVVSGLVRFDPGAATIALPPSDLALRQEAAPKSSDMNSNWPDADEVKELLRALHFSDQGKPILGEIGLWNGQSQMAAIRDGRVVQGSAAMPIIWAAAHPSQWDVSAFSPLAPQIKVGVKPEVEKQPAYDLFGQFSRRCNMLEWVCADPPTNGWVTVSTDTPRHSRVRFSTKLGPTDGPVTVDVIGNVHLIDAGGAQVEPIDLCNPDEKGCSNDIGGRYVIHAPRTSTDVIVEADLIIPPLSGLMRLMPESNVVIRPLDCQKKRARGESSDPCTFSGMRHMQLGQSLRLHCNVQHRTADLIQVQALLGAWRAASAPTTGSQPRLKPELPCTFAWERPRPEPQEKTPDKVADPIASVTDVNGMLLADNDRKRLDHARLPMLKAGLAPAVGVGGDDRRGALRLAELAAAEGGQKLELSIDLELQAQAQEILSKNLSQVSNSLPAEFADERMGALVLIDASDPNQSPNAGQIIAAASWPNVGAGSQDWNLLAEYYGEPSKSSLTPRAWSIHTNQHFAPGSTFKALSALTLIKAAVESDSKNVENAIRGQVVNKKDAPYGDMNVGDEKPGFDFGFDLPNGVETVALRQEELVYDRVARRMRLAALNRGGVKVPTGSGGGPIIRNFLNENAWDIAMPPSQTGCPEVAGQNTPQVGMCEAIIKSLNSWFIAGILSISPQVPPQGEFDPQKLPFQKLPITEMLNRFGMQGSLVPDRPVGRDHRAYWKAFTPGLFGAPEHPMLTLALTSIGQDVQASPLGIAALYGSIGSGCVLTPRLTKAGGKQGCSGLFFPNDREKEAKAQKMMTTYMYPGFKGVVTSSGGSGYGAFGGDYNRVHGKTGTATTHAISPRTRLDLLRNGIKVDAGIHGKGMISGWFAGWMEPEKPNGRRVAFACMVTHAHGTGGARCAPLVKELLDKVDEHDAGRGRP